MDKSRLWTVGILVVTVVIVVSMFVWFVSGVTATIPPIKTYKYIGKPKLLVSDLKMYEATNKYLSVDIIDTLIDEQNTFGYEMIVKYERKGDTLRYHLKCVEDQQSNTTTVELIGAHDLNNDTGGYGLEARGMDILLSDFDTYLVDSLKSRYRLQLNMNR
jgi:hypothetical protein